jgi:VanZ like family
MVTLEFTAIPGFLPGVVISLIVALVVSRPVAAALGTDRWVAWLMVAGLGTILSATLTPSLDAIHRGAIGAGTCDLERFGLASLRDLLRPTDAGLNVVLFIPLGLSIGFLRRSRQKAAILLAAILLPFAIELVQLAVPMLDRACQSADVIDNLSGLGVGLVVGTIASRFAPDDDAPGGPRP